MPRDNSTSALQESLGMKHRPRDFQNIKETLKMLTHRHFDFDEAWMRQPHENWDNFLNELEQLYPTHFKQPLSTLRLRQLRSYANGYFNLMTREALKRKNKPSYDGLVTRRQYTSSQSSTNGDVPSGTEPIKISPTRAVVEFPSLSAPLTQPSTTKGNAAVEMFLRGCKPSLSEFLPVFLHLGFKDEQSLRGTAAWPSHELTIVLEKWKATGILNSLQVETLRMAFGQLRGSD